MELPQDEAQTLLQEYKNEAHRLLPPNPKPEKKKLRLHKKRPYGHSPPMSHRMQWARSNGQYEKWQCVLRAQTITDSSLICFFLVSVGWNNTRPSWRQQPTYVSGVKSHRTFNNKNL